jgi:hypothetical protein
VTSSAEVASSRTRIVGSRIRRGRWPPLPLAAGKLAGGSRQQLRSERHAGGDRFDALAPHFGVEAVEVF